jgi:hypothetical protein
MDTSELQQQITQTLAEGYNLLMQADLGLKGRDLAKAGALTGSFQEIIKAFADGSLVVTEYSDIILDEIADVEQGDADEIS